MNKLFLLRYDKVVMELRGWYLNIPDYVMCVSNVETRLWYEFKKVVFGIIYYVENDYILLLIFHTVI